MNAIVIEAAGWTMLHFLWQGAVIGGLLGLFLAMVRKRPQVRYLAGCLALLAMVGAAAGTFVSHYRPLADRAEAQVAAAVQAPFVKHTVLSFNRCRPCHSVTDPIPGAESNSGAFLVGGCDFFQGGAIPVGPAPAPPPPADPAAPDVASLTEGVSSVFSGMMALWLAGVVLLSLRFTVSCGVAGRLRRCGTGPVEASIEASLRRMAGKIGVKRPVQALMSGAVMVPTVVGWLRPVILLPAASLVGLSRAQLEAVLAHELAHIRRHDYLVNLLQHMMETVFFFHPAVWWVSKKIREEREHCCDDIAAAASGSALDYARALAALEECRGDRLVLGMAADGGSLLARIRRLGGAENAKRRPLLIVSVLILLAGVAIPFTVLPGKESAQARQNVRPAKSVKVLPLPSEQAVKGLRHLLGKEPETDIPYEDFVRLAESLDDAALLAMIEEIGLSGGEGYAAWTRSALFTEWARRDLDAALDYFNQHLDRLTGGQDVLYALFVGSRPADPGEAIAYLHSLSEDPRFIADNTGRYRRAGSRTDWVKTAYRRLFEELAALGAERAWTALPKKEGDTWNWGPAAGDGDWDRTYRTMVEGLFAGLPDAESVQRYRERLGSVDDMTAIVIAQAWMKHDLEAAIAWAEPMRVSINGESVMIGGVRGNAVNGWARENPEQALEALRGNVFTDLGIQADPAGQLLRGNPHLAPELVEVLSDSPPGSYGRPAAWFALHSGMYELGKPADEDRFPEPGRRNQPPDYTARLESIRTAMQHESISPELRAGLQERLDSVFYNIPVRTSETASTDRKIIK